MARPKCPNHCVNLDPSGEPRIWICPVSDARFEVDTDAQAQHKKFDKFGRPMTSFTIKPLDGAGG